MLLVLGVLLALGGAASVEATQSEVDPQLVDMADHELSVVRDRYEVVSRWHTIQAVEPGQRIRLLTPLPEGASLAAGGFSAIRDGRGRVTALVREPGAPLAPGDLRLTATGELHTLLEAGRLPIAMPGGDAIHRVAIHKALRFGSAPELQLDNRFGIQVGRGISRQQRRAVDRHFGGAHAHRKFGALYTRPQPGGLRGNVSRAERHRLFVAAAAGAAFLLSILGLTMLYRRARRRVREEEVDRYLAGELERFDAEIAQAIRGTDDRAKNEVG